MGTSANNSISFNTSSSGEVNYTWETILAGQSGSGILWQSYNGGRIGLFTSNSKIKLKIAPQNLQRFYFNGNEDVKCLVDVSQWGTVQWTSMENAFNRCINLNITATDVPDLSRVSSMNRMFQSCSKLNGPANIGTWNTQNVSEMGSMFEYASSFNQAIGNWNTQNVSNMSEMFYEAIAFNQAIGNWNTQNVRGMSWMFGYASSFNQSIGNWNTQNVRGMGAMFRGASSFNQAIGNWNTQNVSDMRGMFAYAAAFNQAIGNWNTQNVSNMSNMFTEAIAFNQAIGNWNTQNVSDMRGMFSRASAFNQAIGNWNTQNVRDMGYMFYKAIAFNQSLGSWNIKYVNDAFAMLNECGMDCNKYSLTLSGWAQNPQTTSNLILGSSDLKYGKSAKSIRDLLTKLDSEGGKGWRISGDVMVNDDCGLITSTKENWVSSGWTIYPNPAQELLYIKNIPENTAYQIVDAMGREVLSGYCNNEQIPLPKLNQGLYSLRIGKQQKHFVKE